jgi:ATP/maltotriose-dependent transcriptional regulator MalT
MPRDVLGLIINLKTLLKLPASRCVKEHCPQFIEFLQSELSRREFFSKAAGVNGHIRGFAVQDRRKTLRVSAPGTPNSRGTPGDQRHWYGVNVTRHHPMEHFDGLKKIARLRIRTHEPLTNRERQIMLVLSAGVTNKEIALRLRLAQGTVKVHLHRI